MPGLLPQPAKQLLVISAHWEEQVPTVTAAAAPGLLYDYQGFPRHTYALQWPAPGSPELAGRVQSLMSAAGIDHAADAKRGLDHGVFVPLKLSYPEARIPTVQLSLRRGLDPAEHLAIGRALTPLRDEGVLIIGSGMSYHNMRGFLRPSAKHHSAPFDGWLAETVALPGPARDARLRAWDKAPSARASHPREEHLLPLMVAAGAAGTDPGRRVFRDEVMGAVVSAVVLG